MNRINDHITFVGEYRDGNDFDDRYARVVLESGVGIGRIAVWVNEDVDHLLYSVARGKIREFKRWYCWDGGRLEGNAKGGYLFVSDD